MALKSQSLRHCKLRPRTLGVDNTVDFNVALPLLASCEDCSSVANAAKT